MSALLTRVFSAYDESLNKAHSKSYHLSIQISLDGFSFTIFNTLNSKFLSLESVEFSISGNPMMLAALLEEYVLQHDWLSADFEGVSVIYETPGSTLIPSPLYDPEDKGLLARFNFEVSDGTTIRHDRLVNADAYLIHSVPDPLLDAFRKLFPAHGLKSHASVLIEELLILNKNLSADRRMFVNVRNAYLDIVITEGRQLLFFNTFPYHSKQDFVYYIIFVIEQLNLNPEEIELRLSGKIDKRSTLYDLAWKYIRHIGFQELTASFRYGYLFNDVPSHHYFTLLNSGLCES